MSIIPVDIVESSKRKELRSYYCSRPAHGQCQSRAGKQNPVCKKHQEAVRGRFAGVLTTLCEVSRYLIIILAWYSLLCFLERPLAMQSWGDAGCLPMCGPHTNTCYVVRFVSDMLHHMTIFVNATRKKHAWLLYPILLQSVSLKRTLCFSVLFIVLQEVHCRFGLLRSMVCPGVFGMSTRPFQKARLAKGRGNRPDSPWSEHIDPATGSCENLSEPTLKPTYPTCGSAISSSMVNCSSTRRQKSFEIFRAPTWVCAGHIYYYNRETKVSVWTKPGEMASDVETEGMDEAEAEAGHVDLRWFGKIRGYECWLQVGIATLHTVMVLNWRNIFYWHNILMRSSCYSIM